MLQLIKQLDRTDHTPERPNKPMHSYHSPGSSERTYGAVLRESIALRCWSRQPEARPQMAEVEEILQQRFSDIIAKPIEI